MLISQSMSLASHLSHILSSVRYPHLVHINTTAATHPAFVAAAPEAQVDYRV